MRKIIVVGVLLAALSGSAPARAVPQRTWLPLYVSAGTPWGGGDGYPDPR